MNKTVFAGFKPSLLAFLAELSEHNNRPWFAANKHRYEAEVLEPALDFIEAMDPWMRSISPYFEAIPSRTGGSLMRIYRDTRFGKDKTPYKTNVGIQFRHERGRDVHAPGYYVHLAPDGCFLCAGMWRPPPPVLKAVREAILEDPEAWLRARDHRPFRRQYVLDGDSLKRPPRGVPVDHVCVEDLKRTDHIGTADLGRKDLARRDLAAWIGKRFAAASPYMKFLCDATGLRF